jgi:hypothetical protein
MGIAPACTWSSDSGLALNVTRTATDLTFSSNKLAGSTINWICASLAY